MLMRDRIEDFKVALDDELQDVQGMSGETVMHSIIFYNKKELISYIVSSGFSSEMQDDFGVTPLMLATQLKRIELIKELLKYTKNIDLRDFMGNTALIKAVESNNHEIVFLLLKHHANKTIVNDLGQKPSDVVKDNDIADLLK
jgi:ankyrin repeat protein